MSKIVFSIAFLLLSQTLRGDEKLGELIFEDSFDRNESQEEKEELTQGWASNSKSRAKGNKQVDLKDGALRIYIHEAADHAVSVTHAAEFQDGSVQLRFKLDNEQDSLGLDFADLQCKTVWAGHLFLAKVDPARVTLQDLKTGNMDLEIRTARTSNRLTPEQKEMLKTKQKVFPRQISVGQWHELLVTIEGDTLSARVDGEPAGSFQSAGIAHPTKKTLRLSVPRQAMVDDVKIWRKK